MGMPLAKKTLAEFLAWEEHQPERHEFFRGETVEMRVPHGTGPPLGEVWM